MLFRISQLKLLQTGLELLQLGLQGVFHLRLRLTSGFDGGGLGLGEGNMKMSGRGGAFVSSLFLFGSGFGNPGLLGERVIISSMSASCFWINDLPVPGRPQVFAHPLETGSGAVQAP